MALLPEDVIKLLLAVVIGGLIGAEREYRDKVAGFRTLIFICVGATLFTLFSIKLGGSGDPARIAANIVSGVGFLGAGAIMRSMGRVTGLTTAAMIWLAAALGMGIGGGAYLLVGLGALVTLVVLFLFPRIEARISRPSDVRTYEVVSPISADLLRELENMIAGCGLCIKESRRSKVGTEMTCTWSLSGPPKGHTQLTEKLLAHDQVKQFKV